MSPLHSPMKPTVPTTCGRVGSEVMSGSPFTWSDWVQKLGSRPNIVLNTSLIALLIRSRISDSVISTVAGMGRLVVSGDACLSACLGPGLTGNARIRKKIPPGGIGAPPMTAFLTDFTGETPVPPRAAQRRNDTEETTTD